MLYLLTLINEVNKSSYSLKKLVDYNKYIQYI